MAFKLVRYGIGGRTVEELNERMTLDEFIGWMAFSALEPFGDDRADWHNAMILAQQANMNRKKGKSPYTPDRFLLRFRQQRKPTQSMDDMKSALMAQYRAMGGKRN
jgi:hypothetical protein